MKPKQQSKPKTRKPRSDKGKTHEKPLSAFPFTLNQLLDRVLVRRSVKKPAISE
jgi:hypothetical protein